MSPDEPGEPKSRALLIGSALHPLTGPARDLREMEQVLSLYNFTVTKCLGPDDEDSSYPATRSGILSAWHALIEKTKPSDAVVIYYSGHAGLTESPDPSAQSRRLQYLVPLDFAATTENDWRGIADAEISHLLALTTAKSHNVTTIFDCCHSARMARGPTWVKAIDPDDYRTVTAHIQRMLRAPDPPFPHAYHHEHNPHVVSIVAAGTSASAFERRFADERGMAGDRMGILTEALTHTLRACAGVGPASNTPTPATDGTAQPLRLPWRDIMRRVRDRMRRTCPEQYPDVEGPQGRLPFKLETAVSQAQGVGGPGGGNSSAALALLETAPGEVLLQGGMLHGVEPGDVYAVMPFEEVALIEGKMLAEAEVVEVGPVASRVRLRWRGEGKRRLGDGAKAFAWKSSALMPVGFSAAGEWEGLLREGVRGSAFIRLAEPGEERECMAQVEGSGGRLVIRHHQHFLVREWEVDGAEGRRVVVAECVSVLESVAKAQRLLDMRDDQMFESPDLTIDYEAGSVQDGAATPLSEPNMTLVEDGRMYITVTNMSRQMLYVSMFDVCADSVTLLSKGSPSGIQLLAGKSYRFGEVDITGELCGSLIGWPDEVPRADSMPETISLVITDDNIDLRNLETGPESTGPERSRMSGRGTGLARLVDSIAFGDLRSIRAEKQAPKHMRYRIINIPCQLAPRAPAINSAMAALSVS